MTETVPPATTSEAPVEVFITSQLQRFETELQISNESLFKLVDSVKDLTIENLDDREGLKQVQAARKSLKKQRVAIEQGAKQLREFSNKYNKAVLAREKELVGIIAPTEDSLMEMEDAYFEQLEARRIEEERKESARIQNMIDKLSAVDYAVDFHELKGMTEAQFEETLNHAKELYAQKLEEQKKAQEESQRLAKEQQEQMERERLHLESIRAEQKKKEQELAEAERKLEEQRLAFMKKAEEEENQRKAAIEAKEKELRDREAKIEEEEREKKRLAEIEAARKAAEEKAIKDAEEAAKRKEYEEKQALLFGEDSDRFGHLAQVIETHLIHSPVTSYMKSDKGKSVSGVVDRLIRDAYELCKNNSR